VFITLVNSLDTQLDNAFTCISTQLHSPAVVGDITIVGAARSLPLWAAPTRPH